MTPPCTKCGGLTMIECDDVGPYVHCLLCGKNVLTPMVPPITHPEREWASTVCGTCHTRAAIRNREQCPACFAKAMARHTGRKKKEMVAG